MLKSILFNRQSIIISLALIYLNLHLNSLAFSQKTTKYLGISAGAGIMLLPENKKFNKSTFNGDMYHVQFSYMTSMKDPAAEWVQRLNVSYQSLNISYRDQRNLDGVNDTLPGVFGNVISINYNLYHKLIGNNSYGIYFMPGFGFSYDTKTYYQNNRNIFIGSKINFFPTLELAYMHNVNEYFILILQAGYMHYSNAATILPNRGINSLNSMLGFRYKL
jgi:hypothetical protein